MRQFRSDDTSRWREGFGKGSAGDLVVSSNITVGGGNLGVHYGTITGTSGATTATVPSGFYWIGKPCLIHQSQKTGAGNWELNVQIGISGTTATFKYPLQNNYTSGAQIVTINDYKNLTVNAGVTVGATAWNGSTGGIIPLIAKDTITINGTVSVAGLNSTNNNGASGCGFKGGSTTNGTGGTAYQGDSSTGAGGASTAANGSGGGGAYVSAGTASGGGGANGGAGGNGTADASTPGSATPGTGGSVVGNAQLTSMLFGGGGGGGRRDHSLSSGGGAGAGIIFLCAKNIVINSTIDLRGGSSAALGGGTGGGGAGGSCLLKGVNVALGSNKILVTGGTGANSTDKPAKGGNGGVGRIHLDYSKSYSGSTSPGLDVRQDNTIKAGNTGAFFQLL